MHVLITEDDRLLGGGLKVGLEQEGCSAVWMRDAQSAALALRSEHFDVLILDLGLPDRDGLALLRELRRDGFEVPVLILTARDGLDERVAGLDAGADDYLVKPFDLPELAARLRALVRRGSAGGATRIRAGNLTLDAAQRAAAVDGRSLLLSPMEFSLLEVLVTHRDHVVRRRQLESMAYGWGNDPDSNVLEVHIHNLRRKLGKDRIRTIRGLGYQFVSQPER